MIKRIISENVIEKNEKSESYGIESTEEYMKSNEKDFQIKSEALLY